MKRNVLFFFGFFCAFFSVTDSFANDSICLKDTQKSTLSVMYDSSTTVVFDYSKFRHELDAAYLACLGGEAKDTYYLIIPTSAFDVPLMGDEIRKFITWIPEPFRRLIPDDGWLDDQRMRGLNALVQIHSYNTLRPTCSVLTPGITFETVVGAESGNEEEWGQGRD